MGQLLSILRDEMKKHPGLIIIVGILAVGQAGWSAGTYASKDEMSTQMDDLKTQIDSVKDGLSMLARQVRIDSMQNRIRTLNSDIYELERLEENGEANDRDVDRMLMLRSDLAEAERELEQLLRQQ